MRAVREEALAVGRGLGAEDDGGENDRDGGEDANHCCGWKIEVVVVL